MSVTLVIIAVTCLVSIQSFYNQSIFDRLKHYPVAESRDGEYYRMLTSGFVHGSWAHLAINMFVLYSFGGYVEQEYQSLFGVVPGRIVFLLLYLTAIVCADLPTFQKRKDDAYFSSVGASGAISALTFVFILFNPWAEIELYFAIPFRAIVFGVLYLVYSQWASRNSNDHIDHTAHYYGALYGIVFTIALKPNIFSHFINEIVNQSPWW